ncbi:hypothetical protein LXA43DRAFT_895317, partial [Ganoderma leucocontextum]
LPLEVIERVIDLSGDSPLALCSLSLACRQLYPRRRCLLFARVFLRAHDCVSAFVDFLQANPDLKPRVHSIVVVSPTAFRPILPNLSSIEFDSSERFYPPLLDLHHSSLACFRRLGTYIHTLHLRNVSFSTSLAFSKVLFAFASITHLVCEQVKNRNGG